MERINEARIKAKEYLKENIQEEAYIVQEKQTNKYYVFEFRFKGDAGSYGIDSPVLAVDKKNKTVRELMFINKNDAIILQSAKRI